MSEYLDRLWTLQQWWASISIGVLIMAHLATARLNLFLVLISLGLYTSYTAFVLQMLRENTETIAALALDLKALIQSGVANSKNATVLISTMDANPFLFYLTFGGTYLGVCSYLIYSYFKSRGKNLH